MFTAYPREVDGSKTFLQMFYFACNHGLNSSNISPPLLDVALGVAFYLIHPCVCTTVRDLFPQYLWYALIDFRQTFVASASSDKDKLVRFWGEKVTVLA